MADITPQDASFLFKLPQVQAPDVLGTFGKGLTLADLMGRVQQQQLLLQQTQQLNQAYGDPSFVQGLSQFIGSASGAPSAGTGTSSDPNAPPAPSMADMLKNVGPMARPAIIKSLQEYMKTGAEISAQRATAAEKDQQVRKMGVDILGNGAAKLASQPGPITTTEMAAFLQQAKYVGTPNEMFTTMPSLMDQDALKQWMSVMAAHATNPEQQANIWKLQQTVPADVAKTQAETRKADTETGLLKFQADTARISANAAASNAATERAKYTTGTSGVSGLTGGLYNIAPSTMGGPPQVSWIGAGGAPPSAQPPGAPAAPAPQGAPPPGAGPPAAAPPAPPPGPVQVEANAAQKVQEATLKPRLEQANSNTEAARRILQITPALRQLITSGYNGPLSSNATGRTVLQALGQLGFDTSRFADMRASDVLTSEMLGPLAHQLSTRGSNMALGVAQNAKAGSENSAGVRLRMLDASEMDARNLIAYGDALNTHLANDPTDFGLTRFVPPKPQTLRASTSVERLPPPSSVPVNTIATDDATGQRMRSDGKKWVPAP